MSGRRGSPPTDATRRWTCPEEENHRYKLRNRLSKTVEIPRLCQMAVKVVWEKQKKLKFQDLRDLINGVNLFLTEIQHSEKRAKSSLCN